jgi:hypothetical protein
VVLTSDQLMLLRRFDDKAFVEENLERSKFYSKILFFCISAAEFQFPDQDDARGSDDSADARNSHWSKGKECQEPTAELRLTHTRHLGAQAEVQKPEQYHVWASRRGRGGHAGGTG